MSDPWVSVLLPVRDGASYLHRALDSLVAQQEEGVEVVAIDDGSTDETPDILDAYRETLEMKVLERRLGNWAAATNEGLKAARGRYISILHYDDEWVPGRLSTLRAHIKDRAGLTLAVHPSSYIDGRGRRLGMLRCPLASGESPADLVLGSLLVQNFIAPPAALFPREIASRVGGMDEGLWYAPDWDLWLKLAAAGKTLHIPAPLARYRLHPGSLTSTRTGDQRDFRFQLETVLERHLPVLYQHLGEAADVETQARLSVELNLALVAFSHGQAPDLRSLLSCLLRLGPGSWKSYLRNSRLFERIAARLRAGLILPMSR